MGSIAKPRQSNMELLRIIAILMITMHHTIIEKYRGSIVDGDVFVNGWQLATFINGFVYIGVNLFILISGFWGIKFKWKGVLNLLIFCSFYKFINLTISTYYFHEGAHSIGNICANTITALSRTPKWFILAYIALYFLSPVLNTAIDQMSKQQYRRALIILSIYCLYFGFIRGVKIFNDTGYSVGHFIWLYLIAGYIRKHTTKEEISQRKPLLIMLYVVSCLIWSALTITNFSGINIPFWHPTTYNNPFTLSASIAFFCLFTTFEFHNKLINHIAKSALAVYLLNLPMLKYLPKELEQELFGITYLGLALMWTICRFCVSVGVDQIRKLCMIPIDNIWNRAIAKQQH